MYLNSVGFDPSFFHDEDGRHWLVTLEWDPREGYEHPGAIVLEEYDPDRRALVEDSTPHLPGWLGPWVPGGPAPVPAERPTT